MTYAAVAPRLGVGTPRWRAHPILARMVRTTIAVGMLTCWVGSAWLVGRWLPRWSGWGWAGRALVLAATSTAVLVLVDRAGRRLLPLAMLLELSITFPDKLPRRFSVALRAAGIRRLNDAVARAGETAHSSAPDALTQAVVLLGALAAHDRRTRGHCERVRALNDLMAEELDLSAPDRERLRWAALLHDIGKLHVPASVLNKPAAPSAEEWDTLRAHPELGSHMVEPLRPWLGPWADAVAEHHERWDGGGYPHGLAGQEISLAGRIVALVDAYEVMTAVRPYQRPISAAAARQELVRCSGSHFDPALVRSFLNISIGRLRRVMGPLAWLAQIPFIGGIPRFEVAAGEMARQTVMTATYATGTGAVAAALSLGTVTVPAPVAQSAGGPSAAAVVAQPTAVLHTSTAGGRLTAYAVRASAIRASGPRPSGLRAGSEDASSATSVRAATDWSSSSDVGAATSGRDHDSRSGAGAESSHTESTDAVTAGRSGYAGLGENAGRTQSAGDRLSPVGQGRRPGGVGRGPARLR